MKIFIVTIYNSLNAGAYLQAYALSAFLKRLGFEACFLKTKARKPFLRSMVSIMRSVMRFRFKEACFQLTKLWNFWKAVRRFTTCSLSATSERDVFVFGSDEIWNISRKDIRDYPVLYGEGIPRGYWASYAPTINNTSLEDLKANRGFVESLNKFDKISVRDKHSQDCLSVVTKKDVSLVLDPTFLLKREDYSQVECAGPKGDYILVYGYRSRFGQEAVGLITSFARAKGLRLISIGDRFDWADINVPASPFEFLSYFRDARYVITNTYHGTIFSIIYNKSFVTFTANEIKTNDLLKRLGLESRIYDGTVDIDDLAGQEIDYDMVNIKLRDEINSSVDYIYEFIADAKRYGYENKGE